MRQAIAELELLQHSRDSVIRDALADLARSSLSQDPSKGARFEIKLAGVLAETMAAAEVLGRRRLNLEVENVAGKRLFEAVPKVPFEEAIRDIIERSPALARNWEEARDRFEEGSFALARSANEVVTRHIQKTISQSLRLGQPRETVVSEIAELLGAREYDAPGVSFVKSYADTVFRTNTTSAYNQGRMKQADDPAIRSVMGGWRYDATNDGDVRENHFAADGFVAHLDDPVWQTLRPPLGYNCRCVLVMVPKSRVVRAGAATPSGDPIFKRAPAGAFPDPGFRGRA